LISDSAESGFLSIDEAEGVDLKLAKLQLHDRKQWVLMNLYELISCILMRIFAYFKLSIIFFVELVDA